MLAGARPGLAGVEVEVKAARTVARSLAYASTPELERDRIMERARHVAHPFESAYSIRRVG